MANSFPVNGYPSSGAPKGLTGDPGSRGPTGPVGQRGPSMEREGWNRERKIVGTQEYNLRFSAPPGAPVNPEQIKMEFSREFARKFIEDNIIQIQEESRMYDTSTHFSARMTVAENGLTNVVQDGFIFKAYGLDWTESQIQEALKNTFPEELL